MSDQKLKINDQIENVEKEVGGSEGSKGKDGRGGGMCVVIEKRDVNQRWALTATYLFYC